MIFIIPELTLFNVYPLENVMLEQKLNPVTFNCAGAECLHRAARKQLTAMKQGEETHNYVRRRTWSIYFFILVGMEGFKPSTSSTAEMQKIS